MKTTLNLDSDIVECLSRHAQLRGVTLGKAASDLIRRGINAPTPTEMFHGVVRFQLPADSPEVTTELVKRLENEG